MSDITVKTNNVPRDVLSAWDLTAKESKEFDYLDWSTIDPEAPKPVTDSWAKSAEDAEFFRYRGRAYDLGEFSADYGITKGAGLPAHLSQWDAYMSEHAFSALVIRWVDDFERVVVGHVYS